MRLKQREVENITSVIKSLDGHAQIYLFGSRIDDAKRGGDRVALGGLTLNIEYERIKAD